MKKTLMILLVFALLASAVFAEIAVSGWGRTMTTFSSWDGNDTMVQVGPEWNGTGGRVGVNFKGTSDNVGFELRIHATLAVETHEGGVDLNDFAYIWAKPIEQVQVDMGKFQIDTLRGKIGGPAAGRAFDPMGGDMEDQVFQRFFTGHGFGLEIVPTEGAFLAMVVNTGTDTGPWPDYIPATFAADALANMQVGAGYTIDGVGQIRVQYLGAGGGDINDATDQDATGFVDNSAIQFAFAYTGMEGLKVDAGYKHFLEGDDSQENHVALGATYGVDAISTKLCVKYTMPNASGAESLTSLIVSGGYALSAGTATLEIDAMMMDGESMISIYPYFTKGLSSGKIQAGFTYTMDSVSETNGWSIPVVMEYWF